jgi:thioredoxin reductase
MNTTVVENYPGFSKGIQGPDLMHEMEKQALEFGTTFFCSDVLRIDKEKDHFVVYDGQETQEYKTIIYSTGASPKWLNVPGEMDFLGRGVTSCATCDGFFYKGKQVVVVGSGDTAMEEALYLSKICSSVQLLNRSSSYKASKIMVDKVFKTENITVHENTVIRQIIGDGKVNAVILHDNVSEKESLMSVDGVFVDGEMLYKLNYCEQRQLDKLVFLFFILDKFEGQRSISIETIQSEISDLVLCNREGTEQKIEKLSELGFLVYKNDAGRREIQLKESLNKWKVLGRYYGRV